MKKLPVLCLLALSPTLVLAGFVSPRSTVDGDGPYTWTYSLKLMPDLPVQAGQALLSKALPNPGGGPDRERSFTILDFEGYVPGSCVGPAGWTCRAELADDMRTDLRPDGDADIVNLIWDDLGGSRAAGRPGARALVDFSAQSIYGGVDTVSYIARNFKGFNMAAHPASDRMGLTEGPTANAVPEPGALALAGLGLCLAGFARSGWGRRPPA